VRWEKKHFFFFFFSSSSSFSLFFFSSALCQRGPLARLTVRGDAVQPYASPLTKRTQQATQQQAEREEKKKAKNLFFFLIIFSFFFLSYGRYSSIPIRPSAGFQKVSARRFRYRQNFAFGDRGCFAFRLPSENVNFEVSVHEFSLVVHVEVSSWCRTSAGRCDQLQTRDQAGNPVDARLHVTFQVPSLLFVFCLLCDTTKRHCLHVHLLADLETAGAEEQRQGLLTRLLVLRLVRELGRARKIGTGRRIGTENFWDKVNEEFEFL
jgi:hypothetical protein